MMSRVTPEEIDELLPQTQCGLCNYGGCMPYAEALVYENAAINLCPPGGLATLKALGESLKKPYEPLTADMVTKPKALAVIRENECIGCAKCIKACPVDAILGAAKQMHTVIGDECTGCELCVEPCPVDCIDLIKSDEVLDIHKDKESIDKARQRFAARSKRIKKEEQNSLKVQRIETTRKDYLNAALIRAKQKKQKNY